MTARLCDTPVLATERFTLRAPEARDYPAWEAFFLSDRSRFIRGGAEPDRGRAWRTFAAIVGHWALLGHGMFVVADRATDAAIGATGPWAPADWPEREVGWSIWADASEGQGAMAEAVPAVLRHVFDDLGWTTAVSYIDPENARSIALAERLGARHDPEAQAPHADALVYRHSAPAAHFRKTGTPAEGAIM